MARVFAEHGTWNERDPAVECSPALDIVETPAGLEIFVDLPGVPASAVHVTLEGDTVLIAGHKPPPGCEHDKAGFHLAERAFGRFERTIEIEGAYDAANASASLSHGELRIVLPRIDNRRGRRVTIPVRG